ncbi:MAG: hypothetical protein MAG453_01433 [Calditrichaeota bacterium]|nr:hypothetical protein [Calditrichota bacterium]
MKLAIPSDDRRRISLHAGRCRGFLVYDVGEGAALELAYRENPSPHAGERPPHTRSHRESELPAHVEDTAARGGGHGRGRHGAGRGLGRGRGQGRGDGWGRGNGGPGYGGCGHGHAAILDTISDCEAFVALGIGPHLQQELAGAGIDVYFTRTRDAYAVADQFARGEFVPHPGGCERSGGHGRARE